MATFNDLHTIVNALVSQGEGATAVAQVDLSNIASLGDYIIQSGRNGTNDAIFGKFVDRIAKFIIANRAYKSKFDFLYMEPFEFGAVLQKVHVASQVAQASGKYIQGDDASEAELTGQMQNLPTVSVKLFSNQNTWEVSVTITEEQIKTGFTSAENLAAFISAIFTALNSGIEKEMESVGRAVIACYMGELLNAQAEADTASETKRMAVNLIAQYYAETNKTVTADNAWFDADFLRWCTSFFKDEKALFQEYNVLRNVDTVEKFTPADELMFLINTKFADNIQRFMTSNVYHDSLVSMPGYKEIDYWQGLGDLSAKDRTTIKAKLVSTTESGGATVNNTISKAYVIGVMYDPYSVGLTVLERDSVAVPLLRSHRTTYYEQFKRGDYIDLAEQGTVYYLEDISNP